MSNNSVNNIDATIDYNEEPVESPRTTPVLDIQTAPHSPKEYERSLHSLPLSAGRPTSNHASAPWSVKIVIG